MSTDSREASARRDLGIELVPLFRGEWELASSTMLKETPAGNRLIMEMGQGRVDGERLSGKLTGRSSADWLVVGPGNIATIDFRAIIETDDDAKVYMQGVGRLDMSRGPSSSLYAYSAVTFETGDDRYRWLNRIQAVCKGVVAGKVVHDEFFEMK